MAHGKPVSAEKMPPAQRERLRSVAQLQRLVIVLIVVALAVNFGSLVLLQLSPDLFLISQLSLICLGVVQVVILAIFARKVYDNIGIAVLCAILAIIPCISLLTLLIVNQRATTILKAAGIKVGLFGASKMI